MLGFSSISAYMHNVDLSGLKVTLVFRWCVFWYLYCAAPERRETNEHSNEAKAFHDYSSNQMNSQPQQQQMDPNGQHAPPQFNQYFQVRVKFLIF